MQLDVTSRDAITAAQSFLLVAPAAANRHLFANFTRVVNDYLEQPPFNFVNTHKHLGVLKKVTVVLYSWHDRQMCHHAEFSMCTVCICIEGPTTRQIVIELKCMN